MVILLRLGTKDITTTSRSNTSKRKAHSMKITTKGQVTIPQEIRERLGLLPHTEVEFEVRDDVVVLKKANVGRRGGRIVEHMRGRGTVRMSTDEILALTRGEGS